MHIQQLEYVLKVAECGSITQAAQQLFISQPSLTKSIMNLENEYNIRLFDRTSKGIQITPEGKDFLYYAKSVTTSLDALNKAFATQGSAHKAILSVASQQFDFLYDILLKCYGSSGDKTIHFNVVECNRSDVLNAVLRGDVNLGTFVQSSSDSRSFTGLLDEKKLEAHFVAQSGVYVCCGPKSLLYSHEGDTVPASLAQEQNHIVLDMEDEAIQSLYFGTSAHSYNMERMVFFNTITACTRFLLKTAACLYAPYWVLGFFKNTRIKTFQVDYSDTGAAFVNKLYWVKRANEPLNDTENGFVKYLLQACKPKNPGTPAQTNGA